MKEEQNTPHDFTHETKQGEAGSAYTLIYCKKCGFVSYDQARELKQKDVPKSCIN